MTSATVRQWLAMGSGVGEDSDKEIEVLKNDDIIARSARGLRSCWFNEYGEEEGEQEEKIIKALTVIWQACMKYVRRQVSLGKMISLPVLGTVFTKEGVPRVAFAEQLILDYGLTYKPGESHCLGLVGPATRVAYSAVADNSSLKGDTAAVSRDMVEEGLKAICQEAAQAMSMYRTDVVLVLDGVGTIECRSKVVGFTPSTDYGPLRIARESSAFMGPATLATLQRNLRHHNGQKAVRSQPVSDNLLGDVTSKEFSVKASCRENTSARTVPSLDLPKTFRARRYAKPEGLWSARSHPPEFLDMIDLSSRTRGAPSPEVDGHTFATSIVARIGSNYSRLSRQMLLRSTRSGEGIVWMPGNAGQRGALMDLPPLTERGIRQPKTVESNEVSGGDGRGIDGGLFEVDDRLCFRGGPAGTGREELSGLKPRLGCEEFGNQRREVMRLKRHSGEGLGRGLGSSYGNVPLLWSEVVAEYELAVRQSIVDYLLKDLQMRRSCRVSFVPVVRPPWGVTPYCGIEGTAGEPPPWWEVSVGDMLEAMEHRLRGYLAPALLDIQGIWYESFSGLTLSDVGNATSEVLHTDEFLQRQSKAREGARKLLDERWMGQVVEALKRDRPLMGLLEEAGADLGMRDGALGAVTAMLSSHIRQLVEASIKNYVEYIMYHTSAVSDAVPVVSPERAVWELHAYQRDFRDTVDGPLPIPRSLLKLRLVAEGNAIAFTTELDKVPTWLANVVPSMVSAVRGLPKPGGKIPVKLEQPEGEEEANEDNTVATHEGGGGGELWCMEVDEDLVVEGMAVIEASAMVCAENAENIARLYEGYVDLLSEQERVSEFMSAVLGARDRGAFSRKVRRLLKVMSVVAQIRNLSNAEVSLLEQCPSVLDLQLFSIDSGGLQEAFVTAARAGKEAMRESVALRNKEYCMRLVKELEGYAARIGKKATNEAELATLELTMQSLRDEELGLMLDGFLECQRWQNLLFALDLVVTAEDMSVLHQTAVWLRKVYRLCEEREESVRKERAGLEEKFIAARGVFEMGLKEVYEGVEAVRELGNIRLVEDNLRRIVTERGKVDEALLEAIRVNEKEKHLGMKASSFDKLQQAAKRLEPCEKLWALAQHFNGEYQQWTRGPLFYQEPGLLEESSLKMLNSVNGLLNVFDGGSPPGRVAEGIKSQLEQFRQHMPLINILCSRTLQERHWEEISNVVGFHMEPDASFTWSRVLDMEVGKHLSTLASISARAAIEFGVKEALEDMEGEAGELTFEAAPSSLFGKPSFVLSTESLRSAKDTLEDHLIRVDAEAGKLTGSTEGCGLLGDLEKRRAWTLAARTLVETLEEVQGRWRVLRHILGGKRVEDIDEVELPGFQEEHLDIFTEVDDFWKDFLSTIHDAPSKVESLLADSLYMDDLETTQRRSQEVSPVLEEYLNVKRYQCPRLFFLYGDCELSSLLQSIEDDPSMAQHVWMLFPGAFGLVVQEDDMKMVEGLEAADGALLHFSAPVAIGSDVAAFVEALTEAMQEGVRSAIDRVIEGRPPGEGESWVEEEPLQAIDCGHEIGWTRRIGDMLHAGETGPLQSYCTELREELDGLLLLLKDPAMPAVARKRLESMAVMVLEHQEATEGLCSAGDRRDFIWESRIKYVVDADGEVWVTTLGLRQPYGYEYVGEEGRLVMTPRTLKCFQSVFLSMASFCGTLLSGPSGKGSLVRDISRAMGRPVVAIACTEAMSYATVGRALKGMAGTGALCLLKDIDRVSVNVLCAVSDFLIQLRNAAESADDVMCISGLSLRIARTFGCFGTASAPHTRIRGQFRPLGRVEPDAGRIAEVGLRIAGFPQAASRQLGDRISSVLLRYRELMGSHRPISGLVRMILDRLAEGTDAAGLKGAVEDVVIPRIMEKGDIGILQGYIDRVFSDVDADGRVTEPTEDADAFSMKVEEVAEAVRHGRGVVVTGPSCSGKSTVVAAAGSAFGLSSSFMVHICAGAYTVREILGGPVDGKCQGDGLFAALLRGANDTPGWFIFDGPSSASVEKLCPVLDAGVLTLSSGDRMRIDPETRLVLEMPELYGVSPGLLAKCPVVVLSRELRWAMVVERWCPEGEGSFVPNEIKKAIVYLMGELEALQNAENGIFGGVPLHVVADRSCHLARAIVDSATQNSPTLSTTEDVRADAEFISRATVYATLCSLHGFIDPSSSDWRQAEEAVRSLVAVDGEELLEIQGIQMQLPPEGPLLAYLPALGSPGWIRTTEACPQTVLDGVLLAPTPLQATALDLVSRLLATDDRCRILLRGPRGSGKSAVLRGLVARHVGECSANNRSVKNIDVTRATDSLVIQRCLEGGMSRRARDTLVPADGAEGMTIVIEDLHLAKEEDGVRSAVELLRTASSHGWMDRSTWCKLEVEGDLQWIVTMTSLVCWKQEALVGFGVHNRLLSCFTAVNLPDLPDSTLESIYCKVLSNVIAPTDDSSHHSGHFDFAEVIPRIAQIYRQQGSFIAENGLWRYEVGRLAKALSYMAEGGSDGSRIKRDVLLREVWEDAGLVATADSGSGGDGPVDAVIDGSIEIFETVEELQREIQNRIAGDGIALWPEAVSYIARLTRVLSRPGGHAVLLSEQGSVGKATGVRIACTLAALQMREIDAFLMEEAKILRELQQLAESPSELVVLVVRNAHALSDLALQEISGILAKSQWHDTCSSDEHPSTTRRRQVHLALTVDHPSAEGLLESWAAGFPRLIESCAKLRIPQWDDSKRCMAIRAVLERMGSPVGGADVDRLVEVLLRLRKATPIAVNDRSLLVMARRFCRVYEDRRKRLEEAGARLRGCCQRLDGIAKWIEEKEKVISVELQPKHDKLKAEVDAIVELLEAQQANASEYRDEIEEGAARADRRASEVAQLCREGPLLACLLSEVRNLRIEYEKELGPTKEALEESIAGMAGYAPNVVVEVLELVPTPDASMDLLNALYTLVAEEDHVANDWESTRDALMELSSSGKLASSLMGLDAEKLTEASLAAMRKLECVDSVKYNEAPKMPSLWMHSLHSLIIALLTHQEALHRLQPQLAKITEVEQEVQKADLGNAAGVGEDTTSRLEAAETERAETEASIAALTERLARARTVYEACKRMRESVWEPRYSAVEAEMLALTGDALLAAFFLTCLAGAPPTDRAKSVSVCKSILTDLALPFSEKLSILDIISPHPVEVTKWRAERVPDSLVDSVGILHYITNVEGRLALIVDPQGRALKWIKSHLVSLMIVSAASPSEIPTTVREASASKGDILVEDDMSEDAVAAVFRTLEEIRARMPNGEKSPPRIYIVTTQPMSPYVKDNCRRESFDVFDFTLEASGMGAIVVDAIVDEMEPRLELQRQSLQLMRISDSTRLDELERDLSKQLLAPDADGGEESIVISNEAVTSICRTCEEITSLREQISGHCSLPTAMEEVIHKFSIDALTKGCLFALRDKHDKDPSEMAKLCTEQLVRMALLGCAEADRFVAAVGFAFALESLVSPRPEAYDLYAALLCKGTISDEVDAAATCMPQSLQTDAQWVTEDIWDNLNKLQRAGGSLSDITVKLIEDPASWTRLRASGDDWPINLSALERAVVSQAIESDFVSQHLQELVSDKLVYPSLSTYYNMLRALRSLPSRDFPFMVLCGGALNIQYQLDVLYQMLGISPELLAGVLSVADVQVDTLTSVITEAASSGRIVILRDVDFGGSVVIEVFQLIQGYADDGGSRPLEGFRIILVVEDVSRLSEKILSSSVMVSVPESWITDATQRLMDHRLAARGLAMAIGCAQPSGAELTAHFEEFLLRDVILGSNSCTVAAKERLDLLYNEALAAARLHPCYSETIPTETNVAWDDKQRYGLMALLGVTPLTSSQTSSESATEVVLLKALASSALTSTDVKEQGLVHALAAECSSLNRTMAELQMSMNYSDLAKHLQRIHLQKEFLQSWIDQGLPTVWPLNLFSRTSRLLLSYLQNTEITEAEGLVWRLTALPAGTELQQMMNDFVTVSGLHVVKGEWINGALRSSASVSVSPNALPIMVLSATTRHLVEGREPSRYTCIPLYCGPDPIIDVAVPVEDEESRVQLAANEARIVLLGSCRHDACHEIFFIMRPHRSPLQPSHRTEIALLVDKAISVLQMTVSALARERDILDDEWRRLEEADQSDMAGVHDHSVSADRSGEAGGVPSIDEGAVSVSDLIPATPRGTDPVAAAAAVAAMDFDPQAAISPMKAAQASRHLLPRGRGSRRSSGVPGVSWHSQTGRWVARWTGEDKKEHSKGFSAKRHGDAKALQMAVATRRAMHVRASDHPTPIVGDTSITSPSDEAEQDEEPAAKRSRDEGQLSLAQLASDPALGHPGPPDRIASVEDCLALCDLGTLGSHPLSPEGEREVAEAVLPPLPEGVHASSDRPSGVQGITWHPLNRTWATRWREAEGQQRSKSFAVSKYGDEGAYRLAIRLRKLLEELGFISPHLGRPSDRGTPPMSALPSTEAWIPSAIPVPEEQASELQVVPHRGPGNKMRSGVPGVTWNETYQMWVARWREEPKGRENSRTFSVKQYGANEALQMAIDYRRMMEDVDDPIVNHLVNAAPFFEDNLVPDFAVETNTAILYITLGTYRRKRDEVSRRVRELSRVVPPYRVNVLLCLVDIPAAEAGECLESLNLIAVQTGLSLILAWSNVEASRYVQTLYKYQGKEASIIRGIHRVAAEDTVGRAEEALTAVRGSASKTDVKNLFKRHGSFKNIISASKGDLMQIHGIGEAKAQVLDRCFNERF
ncbi:hypothetical protein FOL47_007118 [Perkinsus chesapeaki]|uniref:Cytoplasmic dynein 2 heavy chain 1 n=1 Tax=Perkinsus chesapeaki TaxID=330153 RepID=A0A7J6MWZ0_PERCH|nr:hypothetical protein FOL47_007118 [Perkinsus chesapeaki]